MPDSTHHPRLLEGGQVRRRDRIVAHPGIFTVSLAAIILGVSLIADGLNPGWAMSQAFADIWEPLKLYPGVVMLAGGGLACYGLVWHPRPLNYPWLVERAGWGAIGIVSLALLVTVLGYAPDNVPSTLITGTLTVTAALRVFALHLMEDYERAMDKAATDTQTEPGE